MYQSTNLRDTTTPNTKQFSGMIASAQSASQWPKPAYHVCNVFGFFHGRLMSTMVDIMVDCCLLSSSVVSLNIHGDGEMATTN